MKTNYLTLALIVFGLAMTSLTASAGGDGTGPMKLRVDLTDRAKASPANGGASWVKAIGRDHSAWVFGYGTDVNQLEELSLRPEEMTPALYNAIKKSATVRKPVAVDWIQ